MGSSSGVALFSTAAPSEPMVSPAPSTTRIGRLRKYVNGSEFWTITVTPSCVRPPRVHAHVRRVARGSGW